MQPKKFQLKRTALTLGFPSEYILAEGRYSVGRQDTCDIIVFDPSQRVSRIHAIILCVEDNQTCYITDESTHGTWVDGVRVPRGIPTPLKHSAIIGLAHESRADFYYFDYDTTSEGQQNVGDDINSRIPSIKGTKLLVPWLPKAVNLTPTECNIISALLENLGQYVPLDVIIRRIYGDFDGFENVDSIFSRLRKKLKDEAKYVRLQGSKKIGYMLEIHPPASEEQENRNHN
ncbi:MAG: hypothetical protein OHK0022_26310 [Roseiflexaceae bacterium]